MSHKIRTLRDLTDLSARDIPRVGDIWTLVAVTTTGRHWTQPVRIVSTHTSYIVCRAIPPEGDTMPEEQMSLQTFSKATHHRVRHDGTVSQSEWIVKEYTPNSSVPSPKGSSSRQEHQNALPNGCEDLTPHSE